MHCYRADDRTQREESERFRRFSYDELTQRDKANLDIFWLRDESLEDSENLPPPEACFRITMLSQEMQSYLTPCSAI